MSQYHGMSHDDLDLSIRCFFDTATDFRQQVLPRPKIKVVLCEPVPYNMRLAFQLILLYN